VTRLLGEGGSKRVFLAHDTALEREVAVAVIRIAPLDDAALARVRTEVRAMAQLGDHPHVVTVYDVGEEGGRPFIVSQYMAGGDVEERLEALPEHRLALDDALRIGTHVALALEHAHGRGIIHRDVKPANVWLMPDGTAKLGDFGVAIAVGHSRLTLPGVVVGTVAYMAPEQALGEEPDARTDLYSLGAMLYEMLAGRPPFVGDDVMGLVSQVVNASPDPPSRHRSEVPRGLDELVLRLLAKRRPERPQTAAAVSAALRDLAAGAAPDETPGPATGASGTRRVARLGGREVRGAPRRGRARGFAGWWTRRRVLVVLGAAGAGGVVIWSLRPLRGPGTAVTASDDDPMAVGVMEFEPQGTAADLEWMCRNSRDSLNTVLSKLGELRVYAKEMLDFMEEKQQLSRIEIARELGIRRMVTGRMSFSGENVILEVRVVDPLTGVLLASVPRVSSRDRLVELQNEVAVDLIRLLDVRLTPQRERLLFAHRTDEDVENYTLLYDTLGGFVEEGKPGAPPEKGALPEEEAPSRTLEPSGRLDPFRTPWPGRNPLAWLGLGSPAHAQPEPGAGQEGWGSDEDRIRALLDRYRVALEAEDIDTLATLHVELTEAQREALVRYFQTAERLQISISKIDVVVEGAQALASFTREDHFRDVQNDRDVHLEVRISSLLARENGVWKIRGLKKPS
jgi:TolB-like protein